MGNVVSQVNNDGQNSQLFMGNYHNVGSTKANFTGPSINFSGTGQSISFTGYNQSVIFNGTGQSVSFGGTGSTANVVYYNQPTFYKGAVFPDGTLVSINNTSLISNGKLNSLLLPDISNYDNLTVRNVAQINNLNATGVNVGNGNFTVNANGDVKGNNITGNKIYGSHVIESGQNITGEGSINVGGGITGANIYTAGSITGANLYGTLNLTANQSITGAGVVNVGGGLITTTSKTAAGQAPLGGLQINGTNKWIIAENSSGELCFYNQIKSSSIPLACITADGNLTTGTG